MKKMHRELRGIYEMILELERIEKELTKENCMFLATLRMRLEELEKELEGLEEVQ